MAVNVRVTGTKELMRALARAGDRAEHAAKAALYQEAERVMAQSKQEAPVGVDGVLRASGFVELPKPAPRGWRVTLGYGGAAKAYACVSAQTRIACEGGNKPASKVIVGDRVLTQAGVYKPVEKVFRYELRQDAEMVWIESTWRRNKNHKLHITPHHDVLVYRDGKNCWVPAGDIVVGDVMFQRRKHVHNAGSGVSVARTCIECGISESVPVWIVKRGRSRFCSMACYWAWRAKPGNNPLSGKPRPEAVTDKMRASTTARLRANPEKHPSRVLAKRGAQTTIEAKVADFLDELGIQYERQACVAHRHVDFLCPSLRRVIEVDGSYWHRDQARDVARDGHLLAALGEGWDIVHFHFYESGTSPELDPNPIPNAHYVSVNPGPATYVEPGTFERSTVVAVGHTVHKYTGGPPKVVFDFQVQGIASYTAGGLVVHNSAVHKGRKPGSMPPSKALEPWVKKKLGVAADEVRSVAFLVARKIKLRGTRPTKFLEKPLLKAANGMAARMAKRIRAQMERR